LGGKVWLNWDSTHLYVTAQISDANFSEPATGGNIWQGDSLQLAATSGVPGSSATVSTASINGHYEYGPPSPRMVPRRTGGRLRRAGHRAGN